MVDIYSVWNTLIKGFNSINTNYLFIKANSIHNLPPYPYATVNLLNPYGQDKDDLRGTITHKINDIGGVALQRFEEPQMTFSLTFYAEKREQIFEMAEKVNDWLKLIGQQYLCENDIILLKCTALVDKSTVLETEYVYKYGFDMSVRVSDIVTMDIETIDYVSIENKNNNTITEV